MNKVDYNVHRNVAGLLYRENNDVVVRPLQTDICLYTKEFLYRENSMCGNV